VESVDSSTGSVAPSSAPSAPRQQRGGTSTGPATSASGTLRFFNFEKGFGFIDIGPDQSIFSHISAFVAGNAGEPEEGAAYAIEYADSDRGPKANVVRRA
jgi:cold shock CspA family protein